MTKLWTGHESVTDGRTDRRTEPISISPFFLRKGGGQQINWEIITGQDCFASLPAGFMDNALSVLEIIKITYSVLVFQQLKLKTASLSKM
jgi:hypothetical protein